MRSLTARRDSDLKCQAEGGAGLCWVPPPPDPLDGCCRGWAGSPDVDVTGSLSQGCLVIQPQKPCSLSSVTVLGQAVRKACPGPGEVPRSPPSRWRSAGSPCRKSMWDGVLGWPSQGGAAATLPGRFLAPGLPSPSPQPPGLLACQDVRLPCAGPGPESSFFRHPGSSGPSILRF